MSTERTTYGLMAVLAQPVPDGYRHEHFDDLADDGLHINYDNDLVYHRKQDGASYESAMIWGIREFGSKDDFIQLCKKHNLTIDESTVDVYLSTWYDGCDAPMDNLTKDEFLTK